MSLHNLTVYINIIYLKNNTSKTWSILLNIGLHALLQLWACVYVQTSTLAYPQHNMWASYHPALDSLVRICRTSNIPFTQYVDLSKYFMYYLHYYLLIWFNNYKKCHLRKRKKFDVQKSWISNSNVWERNIVYYPFKTVPLFPFASKVFLHILLFETSFPKCVINTFVIVLNGILV